MANHVTKSEVMSEFLLGFLKLYAHQGLGLTKFLNTVASDYKIFAQLELPKGIVLTLQAKLDSAVMLTVTCEGKHYSMILRYEGYPLETHELALIDYRIVGKAISDLEDIHGFIL